MHTSGSAIAGRHCGACGFTGPLNGRAHGDAHVHAASGTAGA